MLRKRLTYEAAESKTAASRMLVLHHRVPRFILREEIWRSRVTCAGFCDFRPGRYFSAGTSAFAATGDCDRACLRGMLDQYLGAVVKHDPAAAPLFVGFRQTENAAVIKRGEGVWKSVTGLGKLQRYYLDPEDASAGYFGTPKKEAPRTSPPCD